jgi:act minimal PKS acyl carrier protein
MFTQHDLVAILKAVGGADDGVDLDRDVSDISLADLGFDSLALLEVQSQIKLQHGIVIPDNAIEVDMSPRKAADVVRTLASVKI